MKQIAIALATIVASFAEAYFLGLNGLTILSIPLTIYLGILTIEKTSETESIN